MAASTKVMISDTLSVGLSKPNKNSTTASPSTFDHRHFVFTSLIINEGEIWEIYVIFFGPFECARLRLFFRSIGRSSALYRVIKVAATPWNYKMRVT